MAVPPLSTTNYIPLDSNAPPVFRIIKINEYMGTAFITLLLYDHAITLDKEVEWIWTLRWRVPKIIFILNRYIFTSLLLAGAFREYCIACKIFNIYGIWIPFLNFGAVELIVIIRVCALYGHCKPIVWSLGIVFVSALISIIAVEILYIHTSYTGFYYEFMPGCWFSRHDRHSLDTWPTWVIYLSFEGVLMLLTAYQSLSYRNHMNRIITLLARDSIVYFIIIFACYAVILAVELDPSFPINFVLPAQCISSIAVGRMLMNLRGLVLDDPEHTVHLQMRFTVHTNSGSETKEVA